MNRLDPGWNSRRDHRNNTLLVNGNTGKTQT
jgi:hypothetical protein